MSKLKITLQRSVIRRPGKHKKTVAALGLRKVNHSVVQQDNAAIRGMINQVNHLVLVEEVEA